MATVLIGKTATIGQSAVNKARVAYQAIITKDRAVFSGKLGVDADDDVKDMAESLAQELVKDLLKPKSRSAQDKGALKISDITLKNVNVNGQQGEDAVTGLKLLEVKRSGFFGSSTI